MSKIIVKKDENKEEFFNQFLKNELDKEVNLKRDIVTVVVSVTKEEDICFLYDKSRKIVVIDYFTNNPRTFPDTTNLEKIARKIIDRIDIDDDFEKWKFILVVKNNPAFLNPSFISIRTFKKVDISFNPLRLRLLLNVNQHNFDLKYEYEIEVRKSDGRVSIL